MTSRKSERRLPRVTIVSKNAETRDGLADYLRAAGVRTCGTADIAESSELTAAEAGAVLLFPDDFAPRAVDVALDELRRRRPDALAVLVTREPNRFEGVARDPRSGPIVVPKPVFGWTILDVLRARAGEPARQTGT